MANDRISEAIVILERVAIDSGRPLPEGWVLSSPTKDPMSPKNDRADDAEPIGCVTLMNESAYSSFKTYLIAMCAMWFATAFGYYGLIFNAGHLHGDPHWNAITGALMEIPANVLCVPILGKIGRRNGSCLFLATVGFACCLTVVTGLDSEFVPVFAMIGKFGAAGAFASVYIFATELFPTEVRALCMGMSSMFARFGALTAQPIIAIGGLFPMTSFGVVCLIVSIVCCILPETLGKPMYETLDEAIAASNESPSTMELQDRSPVRGNVQGIDDESPRVEMNTI